MPKVFRPQVLTANDLVEGDSVFLGAAGWTRDIAAARIAATPDEATALEAEGAAAVATNRVVEPYMVAVGLETGRPVPLERRERIRAARVPTFAYLPETAAARPARAA